MKLYIKQKVFSWRDQFSVKDKSGEDYYKIKGELIALGKKLHIYDQGGREVATIKEKLVTLRPKYEVYIEGRHYTEIVKEITLFRAKYRLKTIGWEIDGSLFDHNYEIQDGRKTVAKVSKALISFGDSYEIDIKEGYDEVAVVACVIALDCVLAAGSN